MSKVEPYQRSRSQVLIVMQELSAVRAHKLMLASLQGACPVGPHTSNRHCEDTNKALRCANFCSNQTENCRDCIKWKNQKLVTAKSAGLFPRASVSVRSQWSQAIPCAGEFGLRVKTCYPKMPSCESQNSTRSYLPVDQSPGGGKFYPPSV